MQPEKGTFKIATVGPKKEGTSKKTGKPYRTYDIQFENDPQWYNTFWTLEKDPEEGMELSGTKSYNSDYDNYAFEINRPGGKGNWNPAAANATVMLASVEIVNGFLSIGNHYELWEKGDVSLKEKFSKYMATVEAASKQIREKVIGMGSLNVEQKKSETPAAKTSGDPGPTPPPEIEGWPEGEELVDV